MNIGIIGHRGFIGSNLTIMLGNLGYSIFPVSLREPTVYDNWNIALKSIPVKLDYVIHAAGKADVSASFSDPENDFQNNTKLVFDIIDALRKSHHKSAGFIFLSSAAVYGNPVLLPVAASALTNPISPYGFHKATAELLVKSFCRCFGMRGISLRIFSAYGEGNRKQVLWELCKKCIHPADHYLMVEGTGEETRDFIHLSDIAEQIILLIQNARFEGEAYNIGNGIEISIKQVASLIADEMNMLGVKYSQTSRKGYPTKWKADISFMEMLGYHQKIFINDGIKAYCNWFKEIRENV